MLYTGRENDKDNNPVYIWLVFQFKWFIFNIVGVVYNDVSIKFFEVFSRFTGSNYIKCQLSRTLTFSHSIHLIQFCSYSTQQAISYRLYNNTHDMLYINHMHIYYLTIYNIIVVVLRKKEIKYSKVVVKSGVL